MELLLFSLLLCGAWAQTSPPPGPAHGNHTGDGGVLDDYWGNWVSATSDRSFRSVRSAVTWAEAQQRCVALGGTLATIHTQREGQYVSYFGKGEVVWIGFSDAQQEGIWLWSNSKPVTFTGWCAGEPNNHAGHQHCAVINFTDKECWDDKDCSIKLPFVCEKWLQNS